MQNVLICVSVSDSESQNMKNGNKLSSKRNVVIATRVVFIINQVSEKNE